MNNSKRDVLYKLISLIATRKKKLPNNSYATFLFNEGVATICSKIDEESQELLKAAKHENKQRLVEESVDLIYHLLILLAEKNIEWIEILNEMEKRMKK